MALGFVSAVASSAPLPIVLFQLSWASGLGYSPPLLGELCRKVPSIIAVKEGSDLPHAYEDNLQALRACGRRITVLTIDKTWLYESLVYGADGILSGSGSVSSTELGEMFAAHQRGDPDAARSVNDRIRPLLRVFYSRPFFDIPQPDEDGAQPAGQAAPRAAARPLLPVTPAERAEIQVALVAAGLLRTGARAA